MKKISDAVALGDEAQAGVAQNKPVVTLESTIIAFGLPYPENLKMARECEDIIRSEGAVPATIGIIDGKLKIGLDENELEQFAIRKDIVKTNLSNIAAVCARGIWGATSVSTSLMATSLAGIGVFVTGGIGGVHKGFGESFDISSDLTALSRYRAIVVSAGVKSLLDVRASLEYLETMGIPVLGYGTDSFPVFYIRQSPYRVDMRVNSPEEAVAVFTAQEALGHKTSLLTAVPVPAEAALSSAEVEAALAKAEAFIKKEGDVHGRDVTPAILKQMNEITGGRCLKANLALIKNNARVGAMIARELSRRNTAH